MWDLWWTKWHWGRFFSEYFGFPLAISFHQCSIKMEKHKKNLIIFITGFHNKPSRLRCVRSICCNNNNNNASGLSQQQTAKIIPPSSPRNFANAPKNGYQSVVTEVTFV